MALEPIVDQGVRPQSGRLQALLLGQGNAHAAEYLDLRAVPVRLGVDQHAVHVENHCGHPNIPGLDLGA